MFSFTAVVFDGTSPTFYWIGGFKGSLSWSGWFWGREKSLAPTGIQTPDHSVHTVVTMLATLWKIFPIYYYKRLHIYIITICSFDIQWMPCRSYMEILMVASDVANKQWYIVIVVADTVCFVQELYLFALMGKILQLRILQCSLCSSCIFMMPQF